MKKVWVVGVIVGLHAVVIGALLLSQGCGTPPKAQPPPAPAPVVMPPQALPPAPVVAPPVKVAPPPAELPTKTYTVKAGDSLSRIAQRFNVSQRDLLSMNKLSDPNKLRVGQKLTLPGYVDLNAPEPPRRARPKPVQPAAPAVAGGEEYVVKAGDSLSSIARAHGVTIRALREVNNLSGDKLLIGQKLKLPAAAAAPTPTPAVTPTPAETPMETAPTAAPPVPAGPAELVHIVEANQDLQSIAMMYGVRVEELMKLNGLTTPEVKVGQTLKIPPSEP